MTSLSSNTHVEESFFSSLRSGGHINLLGKSYADTCVGLNSQKHDQGIVLNTAKSEELIAEALKSRILDINHESCEAGAEDSFFVCDLGKIERLLKIWRAHLPRVEPFYAVKCNPNEEVLKLLSSLGVNFDCASKGEIDRILSLGVDASRIIYAHPCKVGSFLRCAKKKNVKLTTFDNADELYKLHKFHPECKLLLRIITDDESAQCRLSTKYGAPLENVPDLLRLAKELNLNVGGVSFHVGSGASDTMSLLKAVRDASDVFRQGISMGFSMDLLDVGGGFSSDSFLKSSQALRTALDTFFPVDGEGAGVRVIAEPGRFFVADAFTLATHVIAKRDGLSHSNVSSPAMIYINDGVYGNMNCILFDHQHPQAYVLKHDDEFLYGDHLQGSTSRAAKKYTVSIWGPTCDGLDCVSSSTQLSRNVAVGDWLYFPGLGAYTSAAASSFNGFNADAATLYVRS